MHRPEAALETRLAEVLMSALFPCDLGDGIEVVHDVEVIEIEMDCDLGEDAWDSAPYEKIEIRFESVAVPAPFPELAPFYLEPIERSAVTDTLPFAPFEPDESLPFVTVIDAVAPETVPYPRISPRELQRSDKRPSFAASRRRTDRSRRS